MRGASNTLKKPLFSLKKRISPYSKNMLKQTLKSTSPLSSTDKASAQQHIPTIAKLEKENLHGA